MGWRHRGLYTVATRHARQVLGRDEIVAGRFARIDPRDAPLARLPRAGLLVVHGLGDGVPWDAFWPTSWLRPDPQVAALFDQAHRPPPQLLGWMREFTGRTGLPIGLYQCEMSGGLDLEIAFVTDPDGDTFTAREDRGTRQWQDGRWVRARTDPLQSMLRALGARPDGWVFPPHERPLPHPLRPAASVLRRRSLVAAAAAGDADSVRNLLARGADPAACRWGLLEAAAGGGSPDVVGRLAALTPDGAGRALGHAANPDCAAELVADCTDLGGALLGVVQRGYGDTARYLIACGAPVDEDALWLSAAKGGVRWLVERGIAAGVDVDVLGLWWYPDGRSALEWAAGAGHAGVLARILAAGATLTPAAVVAAARHGRVLALRTLLEHGGSPSAAEPDGGETALTVAADGGHRDTVAMLLAAGADPTHDIGL